MQKLVYNKLMQHLMHMLY